MRAGMHFPQGNESPRVKEGLSRMPWISTVRPVLLEKAIMLFGERGYNGVTTRDLARAADIAEGSIYNMFKSKENLYIAALEDVTSRTQDELGQMLLALYAEQKNQSASHFIGQVARAWYQSISREAARFLQQVMISDQGRQNKARKAIEQVVATIASALAEKTKGRSAAHAQESAETLILALFQLKVTLPDGAGPKAEIEKVEAIIMNWLEKVVSMVNGAVRDA
jgi:AcrR family transcriptional regulator